MKNFLIAALCLLTVGIITMSQTCTTPTVIVQAFGTDFNVTVKDNKACLNFQKPFNTSDVNVLLEKLLTGIAGNDTTLGVRIERDSTGNFVLVGGACANIKANSETATTTKKRPFVDEYITNASALIPGITTPPPAPW